ncbi:PaaI family thioesterase [Marinomonas spartinae]|uniref:PaaI family thioesterase n=1 Tax=Marinomonas spartinae TaxID=1792290 RepID=UPI0018F2487B|nr:PaaI family thioesterase [Marinomonas spartinae]MBJ7555497.1 PaaI family thioesterase [Marinomonas spartinae]
MKVKGNIEFTIKEHSESIVISEMPVSAGIKNPFGTAHAGAILWFADVTATVLVMGGVEAKEGMQGFPLAINLNANLVSNQTSGEFVAKSEFVKRGKTVSIVRTTVTGAGDKLIADVTTSHVLSK